MSKRKKNTNKNKPKCEILIIAMKEYLKNNTYVDNANVTVNNYKKCIEEENIKNIEKNKVNDKYNLYPLLEDKEFNSKLMKRKEYENMIYNTPDLSRSMENVTDEICNKKVFELNTHQTFVQNFMSSQTPYNSLLLFHGLGTGKTCSAIATCEEYREYLKQDKMKKIMVVAKPNILENFRYQLFPISKLKKTLGIWTINQSCIGNKLIKEVNPHNIKNLPKSKIIKGVNKIIKNSYEFMGYVQFSNYITKVMNKYKIEGVDKEQKNKSILLIKKMFSNRMLVIDEVHNIRDLKPLKGAKSNFSKSTTESFLKLVSYSDNMKLLLLTATPMFDDYKEIIWLLNLMNLNDNRFVIQESDIFNKKGEFKENGKELLIQKMTGYISFVQGEDPYYFPFRIYPKDIKSLEDNSLQYLLSNKKMKYPKNIINKKEGKGEINYLDIYLNDIGSEQDKYYKKYIEYKKNESFGIAEMDSAKQILNMTYPISGDINKKTIQNSYGKLGLIGKKTNNDGGIMYMKKNDNGVFKFEYNEERRQYMNIFEKPELKKYSGKIDNIINLINDSEGITLVYSQYIYGGCIPMALALEHEGYLRYKGKDTKGENLFKKSRVNSENIKGRYIMITGDNNFSPKGNNMKELTACNGIKNNNGEIIKVVIISSAGSEGLDFKNIRNVHILEPWYNLYRQAQVEGRAIRNLSHCSLKFEKRNTTIFLHGTKLNRDEEPIDLHIYKVAERKAKKIGEIANILKENAVDCLLNKNKMLLTKNELNKKENIKVSYGPNEIVENFDIGYNDNSLICGFMDCNYKCKPKNNINSNKNMSTYNDNILNLSIGKILQRIRMLFKENYLYDKETLIHYIKKNRKYDDIQINQALNILIEDKREFIEDMLGRQGYLHNIGDLYLFKPIDLDDGNNSIYNIKNPLSFKNKKITFELENNVMLKLKDNLQFATYNDVKNKYETLTKINTEWKIEKNQLRNWEKYYSIIVQEYSRQDNGYNIDINKLKQYGFDHIIDMLSFNEKITFLNEISKMDDDELKERTKYYLNKNIVTHNNKNYFIIKKENSATSPIYILNDDFSITPAKKGTRQLINQSLKSKWKFNKSWDNTIEMDIPIGYIGLKRKREYFKIKKMDTKIYKKGQTCEQGFKKKELIDILKRLLQVNNYPWINAFKGTSKKHTHVLYKKMDKSNVIKTGTSISLWKFKNKLDGKLYEQEQYQNKYWDDYKKNKYIKESDIADNDYIIQSLMSWPIQDMIACAAIELLLRHYDDIKKNDKRWFFSSLENELYNIEILPKLKKLSKMNKELLNIEY